MMTALGQVKQPMKLVHSSPRRVPGATPAIGVRAAKTKHRDQFAGGKRCIWLARYSRLGGDCGLTLLDVSMNAFCNAAMRVRCSACTCGVSTYGGRP